MARRLTIAKSLLVVKFFFRILTKTEETELRINFLSDPPLQCADVILERSLNIVHETPNWVNICFKCLSILVESA